MSTNSLRSTKIEPFPIIKVDVIFQLQQFRLKWRKKSLNPELKNQTFHIETNQNQLHTQQTKPNFHDRISILNSTPQFSKNQKWIFTSQKPNCTQNTTTIPLSASPKFNKNYAELRIDPHHEPMMRSHQKNRNSKPLTCNKTFYTNIPEQHSTA